MAAAAAPQPQAGAAQRPGAAGTPPAAPGHGPAQPTGRTSTQSSLPFASAHTARQVPALRQQRRGTATENERASERPRDVIIRVSRGPPAGHNGDRRSPADVKPPARSAGGGRWPRETRAPSPPRLASRPPPPTPSPAYGAVSAQRSAARPGPAPPPPPSFLPPCPRTQPSPAGRRPRLRVRPLPLERPLARTGRSAQAPAKPQPEPERRAAAGQELVTQEKRLGGAESGAAGARIRSASGCGGFFPSPSFPPPVAARQERGSGAAPSAGGPHARSAGPAMRPYRA
ncbi:proline-rich protein 2-like [Cyrtonyx montezumae]|uniref:proline-rich protein 2-like n=1 Tax=Cyrtonyx montezumae TaxID=9017 RepID=UPI0032D9E7E0